MTDYYCPIRSRYIDLSVTFHGPIKRRPAAGAGPELDEALKPRGIKWGYYEGGHRLMLDDAPCRVATHVKLWSAFSRGCITSYLTPKQWRKVADGLCKKEPAHPPGGYVDANGVPRPPGRFSYTAQDKLDDISGAHQWRHDHGSES
jgi:hypothetical protein